MHIKLSCSVWLSFFIPKKVNNKRMSLPKKLIPNLVSIISPGYNSARFLPEMIKSVQSQTYQNWELLVLIDSGTTDNTVELVNSYSVIDPRIKLTQISEGKGLSLSRNVGLKLASGQYIAFLDSDDLWLPEKLTKQIDFMKNNSLTISCTAFRRISEDLTKTGKLIEVPIHISYETLLVNNVIGCLTVIIDQSITGTLHMLETKHEDFLLWLSLLKKPYTCGGLNLDLARYRIVKNSRSANKIEMISYRWKILRQFEKISPLISLKYLFLYGISSLNKYSKF